MYLFFPEELKKAEKIRIPGENDHSYRSRKIIQLSNVCPLEE
jgi:hypothetical protein